MLLRPCCWCGRDFRTMIAAESTPCLLINIIPVSLSLTHPFLCISHLHRLTRAKLDAFVNRCRRLGYCNQNEPSLTQLMDDADERLFRRIMNNSEHVLQPFLPDRPDLSYSYNLRRRPHCNKSLITKTVDLCNNDYIIRATYKDSY